MKTIILNITFLLLTVSTFGQTQILKSYDFNKGGYYLLGTFSESDKNSLRDSMGEFYTDDITLLNKFKKDWTFKKPGKRYACGYHYTVYVCRNGQILESFSINLNCEEIVTNKGYFYFDPKLLRQFYGKLKKPFRKNLSFKSLTEARNYRSKILTNNALIMTHTPDWVKYEGSFEFTYLCPDGSKDCNHQNESKTLKEIEQKIKNAYPNEIFELDNRGGSSNSIIVEIKCNKSLSDKFKLFQRDIKSDDGKWSPFRLTLTTYWTSYQK